jgi:stage II sporulation protein AA (anti-sigma F factor antagonist)
MSIKIDLTDEQNSLVVAVSGQVNSLTAIQLGEALQQAAKQGKYRIVLDFSNVEYISSAGLREVISGVQRAQKGGGDLYLVNPSARVMDLLNMTGLYKELTIIPTRDEAIRRFNSAN